MEPDLDLSILASSAEQPGRSFLLDPRRRKPPDRHAKRDYLKGLRGGGRGKGEGSGRWGLHIWT